LKATVFFKTNNVKEYEEFMFAFHHKKFLTQNEELLEETIYNVKKEFKRLQFPKKYYSIKNNNSNFEICDTYPPLLILPKQIPDKVIIESSKFRANNKLPTICWIHPKK